MPWMKIKVGDEDEVDVTQKIIGLDFMGDDSNPTIINNYQTDSASDGSVFNFATIGQNVVNANFFLTFTTYADYKMAKSEIFRLFMNRNLMRIRTDSEPYIVKYVRAGNFELGPLEGNEDLAFTIPFDNPSGYKYSFFRSDEIFDTNKNWQLGMHLPIDQELSYHFTSNKTMMVYNPSDLPIDPYFQKHDLRVISNFNGANFKLTNQTNGSKWSYLKESDGKQNIILDGINTYLNGTPASANTDYGNLTLEKGWNKIVAEGADTFDVTFSFPFIYLV